MYVVTLELLAFIQALELECRLERTPSVHRKR